jgi:aminopeptidase N
MLLTVSTARVGADTYPRQPGIRIANYTFDISLNDGNNEFVVQETVDVLFVAANVANVELDLCNFTAAPRNPLGTNQLPDPCAEPSGGRGGAPPATRTGGKGMTVTAVTSDGRALTFRHENDRVRIPTSRAFKPGEHFVFTLDYHGTPATGILIGNNKYGDRGFTSNPWPNKARNYLASIDHPSAKAPVVTKVTAPRRYQVVSNGRLLEQTDLPNDLRRTVWREASPICTCLMALGVAPFAIDYFGEYHGIAMSSWVYPQERDVSFAAFRAYTQPILEFFIDHIGPYAFEKLAQVEANGIGGGMELASSIFYGYGATGPGRQLIAHEMAHQWFGDAVAENDWDDVWLSEGFATYFALLYQEFQDGHDAFLDAVKRSKTQAINYALANPTSTIVHQNLADFSKVIANNAQIYQGGAQVLQNIRGVVGTETFWNGIRLYYRRFQNSAATSDDLRRAMEEACAEAGDRCSADGRDLSWLFRELLNRGGVLQVQGSWHYDAIAKQVQVTFDQTQAGDVYTMPIEVVITTPRGAQPAAQTVQIARLNQRHQTFTFASDSEPTSVALDPNAWVMMQATWEKK